MKTKNYLRKTFALVMAFLMIVTMLPINVFAATYTVTEKVTDETSGNTKEVEVTKTTDWSEDKYEDFDYWGLAKDNVIYNPNRNEAIRTPAINYRGTYTFKDSNGKLRTAIRMSFSQAIWDAPGTRLKEWNRLAIKLPKSFYDMVDWDLGTGFYTGRIQNSYSDDNGYKFIKGKSEFLKADESKVGSKNVLLVKLEETDFYGTGGRGDVPFQFVLKEGENIDSLKKDLTIQARIYSEDFKKVFLKFEINDTTKHQPIQANKIAPYNGYTFTTFIPYKKNLKQYLQYHIYGANTKIHSTDTYIRYYPNEGYMDVIYRQAKSTTYINPFDGSEYAIFQSFDKNFVDILKPQYTYDEQGKITNPDDAPVAFISIGDRDDQFYSGTFDKQGKLTGNKSENIRLKDINTSKSQGGNVDGLDPNVAFVKVAGQDWAKTGNNPTPTEKRMTDSGKSNDESKGIYSIGPHNVITRLTKIVPKDVLLNGSENTNPGVSTIIRWYVDTDKIERNFSGASGLEKYSFFTSIVTQPHLKYPVYKYVLPINNDKDLTSGNKVKLTFNKAPTNQAVFITVGDDIHKVVFNSSISKPSGTTVEWTLPYDLHIAKGESVIVHADVGGAIRVTGLQNTDVTASGVSDDDSGIVSLSDTMSGGVLEISDPPAVNEIFTNDESITGYGKYDKSEIAIIGKDNSEKVLSASDKAEEVELRDNNRTSATYTKYQGYKFDTANTNPANKEKDDNKGYKIYPKFTMPELKKDEPIVFTSANIAHAAIPSQEVIEQVQAKIDFEVYPASSNTDELVLERIVPLNKEYTLIPDTNNEKAFVENKKYTPNGFDWKGDAKDNPIKIDEKVATVKIRRQLAKDWFSNTVKSEEVSYPNFIDHNGYTYGVDDLDSNIRLKAEKEYIKRLFPDAKYDEALLAQRPEKTTSGSPAVLKIRPDGAKVIGWTTKQLTGDFNEQYKKYKELQKDDKVIRSIDQWDEIDNDSSKVYIFDKYSPVKDHRRVYAVWAKGINVTLHANRDTKDDGSGNIATADELTYDFNITQETLDSSDRVSIDGKANANGKYRLVKMPVAPYKAKESIINDADENLKEFIKGSKTDNVSDFKDRYTFIGWTAMAEDKLELRDSNTPEQTGTRNKLTIEALLGNSSETEDQKANREKFTFLTNGGYLILPENIDELKDFDLYAQYRPYFRVQLHKEVDHSQRDARNDSKAKGTYTNLEGVDAITRPTVQIGLLHRTAVTEADAPTVAPVSYQPIDRDEYGDSALQLYMNKYKNVEYPDTFTWFVPGYDNKGERISYIGIEYPVHGSTDKFEENKKKNIEQYYKKTNVSWPDLGVTLAKLSRGEGTGLGAEGQVKSQTVIADAIRGNERVIDTYTGATSRVPINDLKDTVTKGKENFKQQWTKYINAVKPDDPTQKKKFELAGYNIWMTNTYTKKYDPSLATIKNKDNYFEIVNTFLTQDKLMSKELLTVLRLKVKKGPNDTAKVYNYYYDKSTKEFSLLKSTEWKEFPSDLVVSSDDARETDRSRIDELNITSAAINANSTTLKVSLKYGDSFEYNSDVNKNGFVTAKLYFGVSNESNEDTEYVQPGLSDQVEFTIQKQASYKPIPTKTDIDSLTQGDLDKIKFEFKAKSGLVTPAIGTMYSVFREEDIITEPDGTKRLKRFPLLLGEYEVKSNEPNATYTMELTRVKDINSSTKLVIMAEEPDKFPAFSDPFTLDLDGPNVKRAEAVDDRWRFVTSLEVEVEDAVGKLYIIDGNDVEQKTKEFESSDEVKKWLDYKLKSKNFDPKKITLIAFDKFNNRVKTQFNYNPLPITRLRTREAMLGDDLIQAWAEKGTHIEITVKLGTGEGDFTVEFEADRDLKDNEYFNIDLKKGGSLYKLQEGDEVSILAYTGKKDKMTSISVPVTLLVEEDW